MRKIIFAHMSDTHGHEAAFVDGLLVPDASFLLHTGDFGGPLEGDVDEWQCFLDVMAQLPHRNKIMVAGNHDAVVIVDPVRCVEQAWNKAGIRLLVDAFIELDGVVFAGLNLAFPEEWTLRHENLLIEASSFAKMRKLPLVVLSHSPPEGVLDGPKLGSSGLRRSLLSSGASAVFFGHIHGGHGLAHVGADDVVRKSIGHERAYSVDSQAQWEGASLGYIASNGSCVDLCRSHDQQRMATSRPVNRVTLKLS